MSKKVTKQDAAAPAAVFQEKAIRRTLHNDEWWFVIIDIVATLTDAADPSPSQTTGRAVPHPAVHFVPTDPRLTHRSISNLPQH